MSDKNAVEFMKDTILGWIGNLMRDLDAQDDPVSVEDVAEALDQVLFELDHKPSEGDYDTWLRDLNDGRGHE